MVGKVDAWTRAGQVNLGDEGLTAVQVKAKVATAEAQLAAGGYYGGKIDGQWGKGCDAGMKRFLRDFPLPEGVESNSAAKAAWLKQIASTGFRTPSTFVRVTTSTRDADGARVAAPDSPTRAKSGATDAAHIRDMSPTDLLHDLRFTTGRAFTDAYDHTSGHLRTLSTELVGHHVAMADDLARRLSALPAWAPMGNGVDQGQAGAMIATSYFLAARWYGVQAQLNPTDKQAAAESTRLYQASLDAMRTYGRAPSNIPGVETRAHLQEFRAIAQQIPDGVFAALAVGDKTVAQVTGAARDREAALDKLLEGTSEARRQPTSAQIKGALFPAHVGGNERAAVQELIVDAHLELQRLERAVGDGSIAKQMFGKAYDKLSVDQKNQVDDAANGTRGYLFNRLQTLSDAETKLATGEALSAPEKKELAAVRSELPGQLRRLQKTPPGYAQISDYWVSSQRRS